MDTDGLGWAWLACREDDRLDPNDVDMASVLTIDVELPASWQTWNMLCDTCPRETTSLELRITPLKMGHPTKDIMITNNSP